MTRYRFIYIKINKHIPTYNDVLRPNICVLYRHVAKILFRGGRVSFDSEQYTIHYYNKCL